MDFPHIDPHWNYEKGHSCSCSDFSKDRFSTEFGNILAIFGEGQI